MTKTEWKALANKTDITVEDLQAAAADIAKDKKLTQQKQRIYKALEMVHSAKEELIEVGKIGL